MVLKKMVGCCCLRIKLLGLLVESDSFNVIKEKTVNVLSCGMRIVEGFDDLIKPLNFSLQMALLSFSGIKSSFKVVNLLMKSDNFVFFFIQDGSVV